MLSKLALVTLLVVLLSPLAGATESLWFPFDHAREVTCAFGSTCYTGHAGLDFGCDEGTPIYASISGTVITAVNNVAGQTCSWSFGNYVKIRSNDNTTQVIEAHLLYGSVAVSSNQSVQAGQYIGQSSNSGYTLNGQSQCQQGGGYHLHLQAEIYQDEAWVPVDPDSYGGGMWTDPLQYGSSVPNYNIIWQEQFPSYDQGLDALYLQPDETVVCGLKVLNSSNVTLSNDEESEYYVELHSVNSSYTEDSTSSLSASNWLTTTHIVSSETDADSGESTWYYFNLQTPSSPGTYWLYMRLYRPHQGYGFVGPTGWNIKVVIPDPPPELSEAENSMAMMSGDFDNDGTVNDLACIYDYEGTECRIHTWCSNGSSFVYSGATGWWYCPSGYPSENVRHAVAGDFDEDGYKDDIAALYDYGLQTNGKYRSCWHVWLGTGSSFVYQGVGQGWWITDGYNANLVIDAVSGDFDEDGDDDIATIYDYPSDTCAIHVWLSTGSSFTYQGPQGWYYLASGYPSQNVKFMVSGDWDNDGDDDVATFYDYGWTGSAYRTRIHTWLSTGSAFSYQGGGGWWTYDGYNLDSVTQVFAGDFNADNKTDVATLYDYGWISAQQKYQSKIHVWFSTGSAFSFQNTWWNVYGYNAQQAWYGMTGYLNADSYADLVTAYDYSDGDTTRLHVWLSTGSTLNYQGGGGWWQSFGYPLPKYDSAVADELATGTVPISFSISQNYPNPFNAATVIGYNLAEPGEVTVEVFNILGQKIETLISEYQEAGSHQVTWSPRHCSSGIYFYRIQTPSATEAKKMVLVK